MSAVIRANSCRGPGMKSRFTMNYHGVIGRSPNGASCSKASFKSTKSYWKLCESLHRKPLCILQLLPMWASRSRTHIYIMPITLAERVAAMGNA